MIGYRGNLRDNGPGISAVVVLCLILLALVSVVQVTHTHQSASEASHCSLCLVAHTAAPILFAAVAAIALVRLGIQTPLRKVPVPVRARYAKLFSRPPPRG